MAEMKELRIEKGFTLIEVILVAIIVALMAITALMGLNPVEQINKSRDSGKVSRCKEAIPAAERYYIVFNNNPGSPGPVDCNILISVEDLKPGACDNIDLYASSPGSYYCQFTADSTSFTQKCTTVGGGTCQIPDDLL